MHTLYSIILLTKRSTKTDWRNGNHRNPPPSPPPFSSGTGGGKFLPNLGNHDFQWDGVSVRMRSWGEFLVVRALPRGLWDGGSSAHAPGMPHGKPIYKEGVNRGPRCACAGPGPREDRPAHAPVKFHWVCVVRMRQYFSTGGSQCACVGKIPLDVRRAHAPVFFHWAAAPREREPRAGHGPRRWKITAPPI